MARSRRQLVPALLVAILATTIGVAAAARGSDAGLVVPVDASELAQGRTETRAFRMAKLPANLKVLDAHAAPGPVDLDGVQSEVLTLARPDSGTASDAGAAAGDGALTPQVNVMVTKGKASLLAKLGERVRGRYKDGRQIATKVGSGYLYQVDHQWKSLFLEFEGAVVEVSGAAVEDAELIAVAESVEVAP